MALKCCLRVWEVILGLSFPSWAGKGWSAGWAKGFWKSHYWALPLKWGEGWALNKNVHLPNQWQPIKWIYLHNEEKRLSWGRQMSTQSSLKMSHVGELSLLGFGTGPFFFLRMFLTHTQKKWLKTNKDQKIGRIMPERCLGAHIQTGGISRGQGSFWRAPLQT